MAYTSTEVKRRYNEKVYSRLSVDLPKETVKAFKEKCARENVPQRQIVLEAVENYLGDK